MVPVPSLDEGGGLRMGQLPILVKTKQTTETDTIQPLNRIRLVAEHSALHGTIGAKQSMKGRGQSHLDVSERKKVLTAKQVTKIGCWNVRTLYEPSRRVQLIKEFKRYSIDILGVSETRWTDTNREDTDGITIIHSGRKDGIHMQGVALLMTKEVANTMVQWNPINERIITARLITQHAKVTVIQCYGPTENSSDEVKEDFFSALQDTLSHIPKHDIVILMGDLNAKVGHDNRGWERVMGSHGIGSRNNNGERLVQLCQLNDLVIGGTKFPHKERHKVTWRSPDGTYENQIDHIIIGGRWIRSLQDTRVYRGADVGTDHYLVIAKLKIKLKAKNKRSITEQGFNTSKLRDDCIREEFRVQTANRFAALATSTDIDELWSNYKEGLHEVSQQVLGPKRRKKEEWISEDTWKLIEQRKQIQTTLAGTCDSSKRQILMRSYNNKDKEVKKSARNDKRNWINTQASKAEAAAQRGDMRTVYNAVKTLSGVQTRPNLPVLAKDGCIIVDEEGRKKGGRSTSVKFSIVRPRHTH